MFKYKMIYLFTCLSVTAHELIHTTGSVNELVLACVEGM